jgi:hypothetical protein
MVRDAGTASGTRARRRRQRNHGRAAIWRAFRDRLLATALAGTFLAGPDMARGQMGQTAMAPAGGVVNRAVQGFKELNENGPGMLYYGINAADRGLGYRGSYMTLGAFVPGFEDDLGGFWAADLRSHLSVYGGFFSNVGAVRKQFLGGSLLGIGVYWDYDGDLDQYEDYVFPGSDTVFSGGQVYNQVGISGEWLTDFGNLRSNGYIPVGTTAEYVGPFVDNFVLCRNGVNAGLAGTDLEVGVYVPGLNDWAGMISVGGYAYGNARYDFPDGQDVVPWFGGVYTRLDMTFIENWDFSLQYNNDSYFDSTGFARLTYRMGGSRRRNVPDQMEQPMMRNEHVVRAHQTPVVAVNPDTGDAWRVIHVDNAGSGTGNGTAQSPYTSLASAQGAATNPYDIVYVHRGTSGASPYVTPASGYFFNAENQYLIGEGSTLTIPTVSCGGRQFFGGDGSSAYPVITNPIGPAIVVNQPGTRVSHFEIRGANVGISDGLGFATGVANIVDVLVVGTGPGQRGVEIANSTGTFAFDRLQLQDLTNDGFVLAADGGSVSVKDSTFTNIQDQAFIASGDDSRAAITGSTFQGTDGTAVDAAGDGARIVLASSTVADTIGVAVRASGNASAVQVTDTEIISTGSTAVDNALVVSGIGAVIGATRLTIETTGSDAAVVSGQGAILTLVNSTIDAAGGNGVLISGSGAWLSMSGTSTISDAEFDGIRSVGGDAKVLVQDSTILGSGGNGISIIGTGSTTETQATILRSTIRQSGDAGIYAENVNGANEVVQVFGSTINGAVFAGIWAENANVDVGSDPTIRNGRTTSIVNTGVFGVTVEGDSAVRIVNASISTVDVGIDATNFAGFTSLIATNNDISVNGDGEGITISGDVDPPQGVVYARLLSNDIVTQGPVGITLTTVNPPAAPAANPKVIGIADAASATDLSNRNFGTPVLETPVPNPGADPPQPSLIQWGASPAPPPTPPILTAP